MPRRRPRQIGQRFLTEDRPGDILRAGEGLAFATRPGDEDFAGRVATNMPAGQRRADVLARMVPEGGPIALQLPEDRPPVVRAEDIGRAPRLADGGGLGLPRRADIDLATQRLQKAEAELAAFEARPESRIFATEAESLSGARRRALGGQQAALRGEVSAARGAIQQREQFERAGLPGFEGMPEKVVAAELGRRGRAAGAAGQVRAAETRGLYGLLAEGAKTRREGIKWEKMGEQIDQRFAGEMEALEAQGKVPGTAEYDEALQDRVMATVEEVRTREGIKGAYAVLAKFMDVKARMATTIRTERLTQEGEKPQVKTVVTDPITPGVVERLGAGAARQVGGAGAGVGPGGVPGAAPAGPPPENIADVATGQKVTPQDEAAWDWANQNKDTIKGKQMLGILKRRYSI